MLAPLLASTEHLESPSCLAAATVTIANGQASFAVTWRGRPVITQGGLGLEFDGRATTGYDLVGVERAQGDSTWKAVWGAQRAYRDHYRQLTVRLRERGTASEVDVDLRTYDEGVALRYRVRAHDGRQDVTITRRLSRFSFTGDHRIHLRGQAPPHRGHPRRLPAERPEPHLPNLVNVEGVAGEEAEPSIAAPIKSLHDVMLPFTRGLMGPLDYTLEFYKTTKTHCHQVEMIGVYDGRSSLRGGLRTWSTGGTGGSEVEFIRRYLGLFDEERVATKLVRWVTVARRAGRTWFVATLGGPARATIPLKLDFLEPGTIYRASIHQDVPGAQNAAHPQGTVDADSIITATLEPDGGHLLILDPRD